MLIDNCVTNCPSCGSNKLESIKVSLCKDTVVETVCCNDCDKFFKIKYKVIFDSVEEIK
jgi:transposase-like protein